MQKLSSFITTLSPSAARGLPATQLSEWPQSICLLLGDLLSGAASWWLAAGLSHLLGYPAVPWSASLVWLLLWVAWRAYQGLYPGYGRSPQTELRLHTIGTLQLLAVQLAAAFAVHNLSPSTPNIVMQWLLLLILALLTRYGVRALLVRSGHYGRAVSVIGAGKTAALLIAHLKSHPAYGLKPVAAYDDNPELHGQALEGVMVVGTLEDALMHPLTLHALISMPGVRAEVRQQVINGVYASYPFTWVVPDLFDVPNQALQPHNIGNTAALEIKNNLRSVGAQLTKRSIDVLGAVIGGLLISPLLLIIALAIKLDSPGPAIYKARRLGRDGKPFYCLKFRSMHRDAEAKLAAVLDADPALKAEFAATHKLKDDPRVTRFGAFLRKTSLDELPQLGNVLNGTMSLVGPRPIVQAEIEKYGEVYDIYTQVRPGMTGYWQANGRSDTSYDERVAMDKFYVTNWTPWLDVVVLIQTVRVVLLGKGAY